MTAHVFLCADDNFAMPLAVTLRSLMETQPRIEQVRTTVFTIDFTPSLEGRVRRSAPELDITFVDILPSLPTGLPTMQHLSRAAYGRLFAVDLLSGVDRAVYLDADLLVRADLTPLFELDLRGHVLAAAQSVIVPHVAAPIAGLRNWRALGMDPTTPYFNSGVMAIDVPGWIDRDVTDEAIRFVFDHPEDIELADQDALNGVLNGDFLRLDLRWNQELALRQPKHLGYAVFDADEVDAAIAQPAIVHFTGATKPWLAHCNDPEAPAWRAVLARTAFANDGSDPPPTSPARRRSLGRVLRGTARSLRP